MRFVKELDLLLVVEGTPILKMYAAGPHKVGQIEPVAAMRKLLIDNRRQSARLVQKGKHSGQRAGAGTKNTAMAGMGSQV